MTNSVVGPRISAKHFPKPNLLPKKVMGYCLVVCCQSDPLELFESQRNHYIWEVCSTNQWDERAQFFSTIMPMSHNQHFKGWTNWAMNFCLICHIQVTTHQPTTTSSRILTTFCRENASTTSRRQKMYEFLCYRSKQMFLIGKNVLIVMVPILINKGVFEPSYNNLNSRSKTAINVCTNLIYCKYKKCSSNIQDTVITLGEFIIDIIT